MAPTLILLAAVVATLLLLASTARIRERALSHRTELIAHAQAPKSTPGQPLSPPWIERALGGFQAIFAFRMRRRWGVSIGPLYLLASALTAAAALWILGRLTLAMPDYLLNIGAALGFFLVPRFILVRQQRRADARFAELFPEAIDMVVRIVRAGLPVAVAIKVVGEEAGSPIREVFRSISDQTEIGMPLDVALVSGSERVDNPDFRFFAMAVALQQSTGGNLAATLETLSEIVRKRRAVRLKARAATAEVRMSGIVLGAMPFFVSGALLFVAPNYLDPLLADRRGNVLLGAALLCLLLAGLTMRAMIRSSLRS